MIRNFFVVAYRQWTRNRVSTAINLAGLTISISIAIFAYLFSNAYFTLDNFHTKRDRLYMIESIIGPDGRPEHWGVCPKPMGRALVRDLPEVEASVSFRHGNAAIRNDNGVFNEPLLFAESDFFKLFDFKLKQGNPEAINNPTSIYLSEEKANVYFPDGNATGQTLDMVVAENQHVEMTVAGVFEKRPVNSSIWFQFIVPYANLQAWYDYNPDEWDGWNRATAILLREGADIETVRSKLEPYRQLQNEANPAWAVDEFYVDPFTESGQNAEFQRSSIQNTYPVWAVIMMSSISLILLALACLNYANNSLVMVSRRFREIGVRKIIGGTRGQMVAQFIGENLLFMTVALALGLLFAKTVLMPVWFSYMQDLNEFTLSQLLNVRGFTFLILLLIITGIGSGLYPALIVSRFKPVSIFRGTHQRVGYSLLVRILTGLQIALTFGLIFFSMYQHVNNDYQRNLDWGYDSSNIVWILMEDPKACETMMAELGQNPDVVQSLAVQDHISNGWRLQALMENEERRDVSGLGIVPGYMEMMGFRLIAGHLIEHLDRETGGTEAVVNRLLAERLGIDEVLGMQVKLDEEPYTIVGIVETALNNGLSQPRQPAIYTPAKFENWNRVVVQTRPGKSARVAEAMEDIKAELLPDYPRNTRFQDESFIGFYQMTKSVSKILDSCAMMALLISLMGLFGLIASQLTNREHEIAVRRVLGAGYRQVIQLITWPFVRLFLIASVIVIGPVWFISLKYSKSVFANSAAIPGTIPLLTALIMLMLILMTLLSQITSVVNRNPSSVLRDE